MNYRKSRVVSSMIVRVTPEIATEWLAKNNDNRAINNSRVNLYSSAMRDGHWVENGQPIIISTDGYLIDGQHRLTALIRAGVSLDMLLVRLEETDEGGVLTARHIPIDIGQSRTASNITGLHPRVASIIRQMIWMFEKGGQTVSKDPEVIMQRYDRIKEWIDKVPKKNIKIYTNVHILAALVLADYMGYNVWDTYTELLNRNYHKLPEVWSSWMRNIDNGASKRGVDKEKYFIANTWRLAKSEGKSRVIVKDIEGELSECREAYNKMVLGVVYDHTRSI